MILRRWLPALLSLLVALTGLGALGATAPASAAAGRAGHAGRRGGPALLPRADTRLIGGHRHGRAAVRALGAHLDDAAARNGMSTARLRTLLETDHTTWVDPAGRVYFKEAPVPAAVTAAATAAPQPAAATVSNVFALHSRPTSAHTIYLNFVGMYVGGTSWNSSALPDGNYPGFSLDGDYSSFSSTERGAIQEIWERVAAAYAPFDVDVTTEPPASSDAFLRSTPTDPTYGTQVLISSSSSTATAVCGGSCAGVAYIGTFAQDSTGTYQPAWVFPSGAGGSITYIAQSVEHEVGHTFGLVHDGIVVNGTFDNYYAGNGLWGPIMGGGSAEAIYQFSKGDYAGAQTEGTQSDQLNRSIANNDDLAVIAESAPLLPDDAGNTLATAAGLGAAASYARTGLISTASDVDVYAIDRSCSGTFSASATPTVQNAPLDIGLTLRNASGAVVASADPTSSSNNDPMEPLSSGMDASLSQSLPSGTYYLSIDGVGNAGSQGYTDYGSIGAYQLTASGCAGTTTGGTGTSVTTTGTTTGTTSTSTAGGTGTGSPGSTGSTGNTFTPAPPQLAVRADRLHRRITARWSDSDTAPSGTALTSWQVRLENTGTGTAVTRTVRPGTLRQTFARVATGDYVVTVQSRYSDGSGERASRSVAMPAAVRASAPHRVHAHGGRRGGRRTARATWRTPVTTGSYPVTGYQVEVLRLNGTDAATPVLLRTLRGTAHAATVRVARRVGYRFRVRAITAAGPSVWSSLTRAIRVR